MYDISIAFRQFQGLIKWVARKYSVLGNFRLEQKDLEGEGYLVLVQCCRSFPNREPHFERYFKVALYNRMRDVVEMERRQKRVGRPVDLSDALGLPDPNSRFRESVEEILDSLAPSLTKDANHFLRQLADPSPPVIEFAWREFCRRNKLHSQGFRVSGYKRFRVKLRHIRQVCGWTQSEVKTFFREVRKIYRDTQGEGKWPRRTRRK